MYEELFGMKLRPKLREGNIIATTDPPYEKDAFIITAFYSDIVMCKRIGKDYFNNPTRIPKQHLGGVLITDHRLEKLGIKWNANKWGFVLDDFIVKRLGAVWKLKCGEHEEIVLAVHELQNFYHKVKGEDIKLPFASEQKQ